MLREESLSLARSRKPSICANSALQDQCIRDLLRRFLDSIGEDHTVRQRFAVVSMRFSPSLALSKGHCRSLIARFSGCFETGSKTCQDFILTIMSGTDTCWETFLNEKACGLISGFLDDFETDTKKREEFIFAICRMGLFASRALRNSPSATAIEALLNVFEPGSSKRQDFILKLISISQPVSDALGNSTTSYFVRNDLSNFLASNDEASQTLAHTILRMSEHGSQALRRDLSIIRDLLAQLHNPQVQLAFIRAVCKMNHTVSQALRRALPIIGDLLAQLQDNPQAQLAIIRRVFNMKPYVSELFQTQHFRKLISDLLAQLRNPQAQQAFICAVFNMSPSASELFRTQHFHELISDLLAQLRNPQAQQAFICAVFNMSPSASELFRTQHFHELISDLLAQLRNPQAQQAFICAVFNMSPSASELFRTQHFHELISDLLTEPEHERTLLALTTLSPMAAKILSDPSLQARLQQYQYLSKRADLLSLIIKNPLAWLVFNNGEAMAQLRGRLPNTPEVISDLDIFLTLGGAAEHSLWLLLHFHSNAQREQNQSPPHQTEQVAEPQGETKTSDGRSKGDELKGLSVEVPLESILLETFFAASGPEATHTYRQFVSYGEVFCCVLNLIFLNKKSLKACLGAIPPLVKAVTNHLSVTVIPPQNTRNFLYLYNDGSTPNNPSGITNPDVDAFTQAVLLAIGLPTNREEDKLRKVLPILLRHPKWADPGEPLQKTFDRLGLELTVQAVKRLTPKKDQCMTLPAEAALAVAGFLGEGSRSRLFSFFSAPPSTQPQSSNGANVSPASSPLPGQR